MITKKASIIAWIAQIAAVVILGQSLFFKFTAHPESVAIFTDIGLEPFGRYLTGVVELIASVLLLRSVTANYGALLGFGTMVGAIAGHFTQIGWEGARGELGIMAIVVLLCCTVVLYIRRSNLPILKRVFKAPQEV